MNNLKTFTDSSQQIEEEKTPVSRQTQNKPMDYMIKYGVDLIELDEDDEEANGSLFESLISKHRPKSTKLSKVW